MLKELTIAVISDLHCRVGNGQNQESLNTYLLTDMLEKPVNRHPIAALKHLIETANLSCDILICPGDLADKVELQGIKDGWAFVKQVKEKLSCKTLIGTIGNHDVDSRNKRNLSGPFDYLKQFSADFPTEDKTLNLEYWTNNYCIYDSDEFIIVNINTCNGHTSELGASSSSISEILVSDVQLQIEQIKNYKLKFKICNLHHHPIKQSNIDNYKDSDVVERGDQLVKTLNELNFDIIIHGHKHDPQLTVYDGLPIFAAGSFSSMTNLRALGAENTFHIIKLKHIGNNRFGIIYTWVYGPKNGWTQKNGTYFPCMVGFGNTESLDVIAKSCFDLYAKENLGISYKRLINEIEAINYLDRKQQKDLSAVLKETYGLAFSPEFPDIPDQLNKLLK
jgi:predicted phosphodiesterase